MSLRVVRAGVVACSLWACSAVVASCGGEGAHPNVPDPQAIDAPSSQPTSVEVSELEISGSGVDRFASCPPPGELGQDWIPPIPPWSPPPRDPNTQEPPAPPLQEDETPRGTPTERAIADTRNAFRACYHHGLIYDPTQDGHVAIVLRVGADGRVAKVEAYGGCDISGDAILCMKESAKKLRFRPPPSGSDTVTIPALFTTSKTVRRTTPRPNDVYAASAFITVEGLRPALHTCEINARKSGKPVEATGTFALDVDARGKVTHSNVDPWTGDKDLLVCAAAAFETLTFPPPPGGKGNVLARISFNPRAGTK